MTDGSDRAIREPSRQDRALQGILELDRRGAANGGLNTMAVFLGITAWCRFKKGPGF